jgi:hypothetical protein
MTFALAPDVTPTAIEDGLVLLDQAKGRYWQLNRTGARTLRLLLEGHSPGEAAERLAHGASGAADRALTDVQALIDALARAGLVVTS